MEPAEPALPSVAPKTTMVPSSASIITREALTSGSYLAMIREKMHQINPTLDINTDEQLHQSQEEFLKLYDWRKGGLWVFAYGSLMWNPAIEFTESRVGTLMGYSRRLDFWMRGGRGTPERPGLMLGLQKRGHTEGVAMLLPAETAEYELSLVWQREMFTSIYLPHWVDVETDKGTIRAVTMISNIEHKNYAGELLDERVASIVAAASGVLGSNADYLTQTVASIRGLGLHDIALERIEEQVRKIKSSSSTS